LNTKTDSGQKILQGGTMKFLLSVIFASSLGYAQVKQVEIKNFNFSYTAPLGEGLAESFSYQNKKENQQKIYVEKFAEVFKLKFEGSENQELEFKNAPAFIQEAETINLNGLHLNLGQSVSLGLSQGEFVSTKDELSLKNMNLSCDRLGLTSQIFDEVLSGCIQRMSFKVSGFSSFPQKGIDFALIEALNSNSQMKATSLSIKNVDLKINGGKFQLSADIKAQISGTVSARGTANYDTPSKKITIKVSEIKFGFLDLTTKVFEELKKQESETLKVNKPYIYITVK
jgi:hypothetical protein